MAPDEFLDHIKDHLALELSTSNEIRKFTDNTDLLGAHAEAVVRRMIKRIVSPLTVWRGGIIHEGVCPTAVSQIDAIISLPMPVPPLFQAEDFALIARGTAIGYLEVKSTAYTNVGNELAETLDEESHLIWLKANFPLSLGVICLRQQPKPEKKKDGSYGKGYARTDQRLDDLLQTRRAVVLIDEKPDGSLVADGEAIYRLVNFLANVRNFGLRVAASSKVGVLYPPATP